MEDLRKKYLKESELVIGFRTQLLETKDTEIVDHLDSQMKFRNQLVDGDISKRLKRASKQ